jgi:TetR/AcrR family transcriptional regulator, regulator of autoinduction and epiphytic fitness
VKSGSHKDRVDGRVARGQRIRDAVLRAMFDLIEEGDLRPTVAEIARRALVSERAVFNHFQDMETLRAAAVALQAQDEARRLVRPIAPAWPLQRRIRGYVGQQARLLEAITPYRRAVNVFEPFSHQIAEGARRARERTHARIDEIFQPELAGLVRPADRRRLRAKLIVVCTWPSWDTLRTTLGFSPAQAREIMTELLRDVLRTPAGTEINR